MVRFRGVSGARVLRSIRGKSWVDSCHLPYFGWPHHDTNPAWDTAIVNDQEVLNYQDIQFGLPQGTDEISRQSKK